MDKCGAMRSREAAETLRHDLGKYVCFEARWLDDSASEADLRAALANDLLRTRRTPSGELSAPQLYATLRPTLAGFDLGEVERCLAHIDAALPTLDTAPRAELLTLAHHARALAEACRHLVAQAED